MERRIRKVYPQAIEEFDQFLWKSKSKKRKEKQERTQRDASIDLTRNQSAKTKAQAEEAAFNAKAAQMRALAAERKVATATTVLEGAQATVQLRKTSLVFLVILILGTAVVAAYAMRENKKRAELDLQKMKLNLSSLIPTQQ